MFTLAPVATSHTRPECVRCGRDDQLPVEGERAVEHSAAVPDERVDEAAAAAVPEPGRVSAHSEDEAVAGAEGDEVTGPVWPVSLWRRCPLELEQTPAPRQQQTHLPR